MPTISIYRVNLIKVDEFAKEDQAAGNPADAADIADAFLLDQPQVPPAG